MWSLSTRARIGADYSHTCIREGWEMNRREFLQAPLAVAAMRLPRQPPRISFAAIGLNHAHINGQIATVTRGGGQLTAFYAREPELAAAFAARFPGVRRAPDEREILEDPSIQLIVSAAIPNERAPLGIEAMRHGKDFMVDKPGCTSLEQLAQLRRVQRETRRIVSVLIERHESGATLKAGELVAGGAIGRVIQTIALAPHKMSPETRPPWFFQRERYGGILV